MSFSTTSSSALRSFSPTTRAIKKWPKLTLYGDANMRPYRNIWMLEEIGLPYNHRVCKPWSRVAKSVHPLGKVPALVVEECCDDSDNGGGDKEDEDERMKQFVILESAAINTFLGDLAREQQLTSTEKLNNLSMLVPPPATPQRAKYDSLVLFVMTEIDSQSLWIHRKHHDLPKVFGEAPIAVQEAKRQFDKALDAMVDEIAGDESDSSSNEERYLLSTGFSAVDILLAHCCSWAQQIGWLGKEDATKLLATSEKQSRNSNEGTTIIPKPLAPVLAAYLKRCRSRPAFRRADELRKIQVYEKKKSPSSKL